MKLFTSNRKSKVKFCWQVESSDCGPACLTMVAAYYGKGYSLKEIKQFCAVTRMGVAVKDIINGAREIGFDSVGAKLSIEELKEVPLPVILYWKQSHFVVLYKVETSNASKTFYHIADPAYGKVKVNVDTINKGWIGSSEKGVAILLQPLTGSKQTKGVSNSRPNIFKQELANIFIHFLKKNKWKYAFTLILLFISLAANWAIPVVFQKTIDDGIGTRSIHIVWALLLAQFVLFLGNFIAKIFSDVILTKLNFSLSITLKEKFLFKLLNLPVKYFDTTINADTLQRLNDQSKVQTFLTWRGIDMFVSVFNIIAFSIILFTINKIIFFIFFALSLISFIWISFFLARRSRLEYAMIVSQSENNNRLYEFVMNMPEIKINSAQHTIISKLLKIQGKLNSLQLRSLFLNIYQNIGHSFINKLKELISIAFCALLIVKEELTLGALLSISYILGQLSVPISNLLTYIREGQDANIAQKRINEVYEEVDEDDSEKQPLPGTPSYISVSDISFKYPGSFNPFVLQGITFSIPENKITAIVGASGSGKTTLLKLLLSYYIPSAGNILVNDTDLTQIQSSHWRNKCGIVLQDGHVFSGTIAENIALADEMFDKEKVINAAKVACLHDFVSQLPMKYNTKVGSIGIQLSGGQKQRLLIARAVYKNPKFLFFDEATSSLDANNEKQIMENLTRFFTGKTVVIIAHRLSTVKNAHQIVVLNQGSIVECGNHKELVNYRGNYFELVRNQLELGA